MPVKSEVKDGQIEYKEFKLENLDEMTGVFTGVASIMGMEDLGGDIIEDGAFEKTLKDNPVVPILLQHDSREVIGEGVMEVSGKKLLVKGQLDMDDPVAVRALGKLKKRLLKGLSIGFQSLRVTYEETKDKYIRHIQELKLWEVSIVTFPMLPKAQVTSVKDISVPLPDAGGTSTLGDDTKAAPRELAPGLLVRIDEMRSMIANHR